MKVIAKETNIRGRKITLRTLPGQTVRMDARVLASGRLVNVEDIHLSADQDPEQLDEDGNCDRVVEIVCSVTVHEACLVQFKNFSGKKVEAVVDASEIAFVSYLNNYHKYMTHGVKYVTFFGNSGKPARLDPLFGGDWAMPGSNIAAEDGGMALQSDTQFRLGFGLGGPDNEAMEFVEGIKPSFPGQHAN